MYSLIKGSPETLHPLLADADSEYEKQHMDLTRQVALPLHIGACLIVFALFVRTHGAKCFVKQASVLRRACAC